MIIETLDQLAAIYNETPAPASQVKEVPVLTPDYRALIAASPFVALATSGPEGLDCSPRGDGMGFVRVLDDRTLALPDRRGNNRLDSLKNVVRDPRVALLFLIPGAGTTLRVNGRGAISAEPGLLESFAVEGKAPKTVLLVTVETVYFQCARAIVRAKLWDPAQHVDPETLPKPGAILAALSAGEVGGEAYDLGWAERAKATLW